jgi:DNA-binding transcriptional LysR family regulator
MLDVRRMQVLREVVEHGSITAAATALGYTPSALSQQVSALEREAGIALLERTPRGVRPTEAGALLCAHAVAIGRQLDEAEAGLADLRNGHTGRVVVRYFATAGAALVAPAVAELRREHPGVVVDLRLTDPEDPLPEVREGRADLGVLVRSGARPEVDGIRFVHLLDEGYAAVLPVGHPLAAHRTLDLAQLACEPWIGSTWRGPCHDALLAVCESAGFRPEFVVESEDYATAQAFVAAGLGVALLPRLALRGHRNPHVEVREVAGREPLRTIYAVTRASAPPHPPLTALLDALRGAAQSASALSRALV